jgi:hypothetical protein
VIFYLVIWARYEVLHFLTVYLFFSLFLVMYSLPFISRLHGYTSVVKLVFLLSFIFRV